MSRKPYLEAVQVIAAAAWADGEIAEDEAKMIRSMIEVGPLDDSERASARGWLHNRPMDTVTVVDKLALPARKDIFKSAVRVAGADGRTVRDERNFLKRLQQMLKLEDDDAKAIRSAVREETAKSAPKYAKLQRLPIHTLQGELMSLSTYREKALLIVNVASECGLTPQYEQLQAVYDQYKEKGLVVLGFPCNQFGAQEPGSAEDIEAFCTKNYGVTFPMMEKIDVKGDKQHDIYKLLSEVADGEGKAGEVEWNFEKFVVASDMDTIQRFRPQTKPDAPEVLEAIKAALPKKAFKPD